MRLEPGHPLEDRDLQLEDRLAARHPRGVVDQRAGPAPGALDLGHGHRGLAADARLEGERGRAPGSSLISSTTT